MDAPSAALCWSAGALGRAAGGQADGKAVILQASLGELGQECLAWRHWVLGGTWDLHPFMVPYRCASEGMTAFCV